MSKSVPKRHRLFRDLETVNGTYLRVRPRRLLEDGDEIRIGSQLLRCSLSREPRPLTKIDFDTSRTPVVPPMIPLAAPAAGVRAGVGSSGLEVRFKNELHLRRIAGDDFEVSHLRS